MELFARRAGVLGDTAAAPLEAYKEGRRDERRHIETGVIDHRLVKKELDDAYVRGLREGRLQRRGSVLAVMLAVILLALIIGAAVMWVEYGSLEAAGAVIDRMLSSFA